VRALINPDLDCNKLIQIDEASIIRGALFNLQARWRCGPIMSAEDTASLNYATRPATAQEETLASAWPPPRPIYSRLNGPTNLRYQLLDVNRVLKA
jgi:hypothetical protein